MEQKNLSTINLSRKQLKDVEEFCKLNKIENVEEFLVKCFVEGYEIEKYGLLQNSGGSREKWVEKEVIVEKRVEVPVEVIIEKSIIEYVEVEKEKEVIVEKVVEKLIEVIKEIPVEKIVIQEVIKEIPVEVKFEKKVYITDDEAVKQLGGKITKLEDEESQLLSKIQQLETSFDRLARIVPCQLSSFYNVVKVPFFSGSYFYLLFKTNKSLFSILLFVTIYLIMKVFSIVYVK